MSLTTTAVDPWVVAWMQQPVAVCTSCGKVERQCRCAYCDTCGVLSEHFVSQDYPAHGEANHGSFVTCRACIDAWADMDMDGWLP